MPRISLHRARAVALIVLLSMFWSACATPTSHPPFPADVMKGVDPTFDFTRWREAPQAYVGQKVEVGGQILDAEMKDGGVLMVAEQLPIVQHPVYGPSGIDKRPGEFDFAVFYPSLLDSSALTPGNRFIVVGTLQGTTEVTVDGAPKREPLIVAQCIHIWKTKGAEIADYPFEVDAGYVPLEQQTFCVSARAHPKQSRPLVPLSSGYSTEHRGLLAPKTTAVLDFLIMISSSKRQTRVSVPTVIQFE